MIRAFGGDLRDKDGVPIPLSSAIEAGGFLFLSGQLALRDGKIVGDSVQEQTEVAIDNIEALLVSAGKVLADVVKVSVWLTDPADFAGFNAVYGRRFARPSPVRSTVVSQLVMPGALVEIEAIAISR